MPRGTRVQRCFVAILFIILPLLQVRPVLAGRGCCSTHGGVSGCGDTGLLCNDGTIAPSCGCDKAAPKGKTPESPKGNDRPKEGVDYRLKPGANVKNLDPRMDPALEGLADI